MKLEDLASESGRSIRDAAGRVNRPAITAVRSSRRLRSGLAVGLVAFVGTVAVVGATALRPRDTDSEPAASAPLSTTAPASPTTVVPTPPTTTTVAAPTTIVPTPLTSTTVFGSSLPADGPIFGETVGVALIFHDGIDGVLAIDPDARVGSRSVIKGQRAGDAPYALTRVDDHFVVGWGDVYAVDIASRESILLGHATIYLPAVEPGLVWLINYPGERIGQGTPEAWQVNMAGDLITEPAPIEDSGFPVFGVPGGLALETHDGGAVVWDAASGTVSKGLGTGTAWVSDAADAMLAWCLDDCLELHITNVENGEDVVVASPSDSGNESSQGRPFTPRAARFSPDGKLLAALTGNSLVLIDTITAQPEVVAQIPSHESGYFIAWSPDGQQLFVSSYSYQQPSTFVLRYDLDAEQVDVATLPFGGALSFIVVDAEEATPYLRDEDQEPSSCPPPTGFPSRRGGICGFRF